MFRLKIIVWVILLTTAKIIIITKATFNQYSSLGVFKDLSFILNILILFVIEIKAALLVAELNVWLSFGLSSIKT